MYHPAAALRTPEIDRQSRDDVRGVPLALLEARRRRADRSAVAGTIEFTPDAAAVDQGQPIDRPAATGDQPALL
jgi:hypothetical protein